MTAKPSDTAPEWFERAVAAPYRESWLEVDGCPIHYLAWGDPANPGLVLVHGGAAHAHWWSFLAPLFTRQYYVLAPDLSGHGDSGRRQIYPRDQWAEEIVAIIDDADFIGPPVLVGHSMGGLVSIVAASLHGDRLEGTVIDDAPVRRPDPESRIGERGKSFRNPKVYDTLEDAMAHFRLVPDQPCDCGFILDHIARHSLYKTEAGWTWKFDARVLRSWGPEVLGPEGSRSSLLVGVGDRSRWPRERSRGLPQRRSERPGWGGPQNPKDPRAWAADLGA